MSDNNEDLAEFSRSQFENSNPWFLTPTKRKRINSLSPSMLDSYLQILDSGAGISGVGQQWKMTDISQASDVTIQGAFWEPMKPTVQGLLGSDKLPTVIVPGMKDDI